MSIEELPDTGTAQMNESTSPEVSAEPVITDVNEMIRRHIAALNKNPSKVQGWGESSWRKPLS